MQTQGKKEEESAYAKIKRLEREASELKVQQDAVSAQVVALRTEEVSTPGVCHAQDIFRLSQDKLRLATEIDLRKAQANRLRLAVNGPNFR